VDDNPQYQITIKHGDSAIGTIKIQLFPKVAPQHCRNFDSLVSIGFYNGTAFHRVIPNFMIQGGDPNSRDKDKTTWGFGDPSQRKIPAEFNSMKHLRGILSAARTTDPNSATSQFFICVVPCPTLDGQYSIYGEVVEGMNIVDYIVNVPRDTKTNNPLQKVEMSITKINPTDIKDDTELNNMTSVYPNPVNSTLFFKGLLENNAKFEILNISGQSLLSGKMINNSIDVSLLQNGLYFLKIANKYHIFNKL
jgi:peptidyl-prolyl cis-trans isomerase B (cyclophilin B)